MKAAEDADGSGEENGMSDEENPQEPTPMEAPVEDGATAQEQEASEMDNRPVGRFSNGKID